MASNKSLDLFSRGTKYLENGNYLKGSNYLKRSCALDSFAENNLNLGTALKYLDKDTASITAFTKAMKAPALLDDTPKRVYNNLGLMAYVVGLDETAIGYYKQGLEIAPDYGDMHWNLSTALLRLACSGSPDLFGKAWNEYDWRFKKETPIVPKGPFGPLVYRPWNGERSCRLLVMDEQGLGDSIMFARFIPMLSAFDVDVTVQMHPPLAAAFPSLSTVSTEFSSEDYDYFIPIASLASFFEPADYTVKKYMSAEKMDFGGVNIGIVTSGSPGHENDRHRSCPAWRFKFLEKYGKLWNLNPAEKIKFAENPTLNDFKDTAEYCASMDFVVCVDTAIVHLCGALGVPTLLLQPYKETDFRWGDDTMGSRNIWYPSVEVYRNPMSWDFVFEQLKQDLEEKY